MVQLVSQATQALSAADKARDVIAEALKSRAMRLDSPMVRRRSIAPPMLWYHSPASHRPCLHVLVVCVCVVTWCVSVQMPSFLSNLEAAIAVVKSYLNMTVGAIHSANIPPSPEDGFMMSSLSPSSRSRRECPEP